MGKVGENLGKLEKIHMTWRKSQKNAKMLEKKMLSDYHNAQGCACLGQQLPCVPCIPAAGAACQGRVHAAAQRVYAKSSRHYAALELLEEGKVWLRPRPRRSAAGLAAASH